VFGGGSAIAGDVGRVIRVDGGPEFAAALRDAAAGTEIVLTDGVYDGDEPFEIEAQGRRDAPIIVRAAHRGRARLTRELLVRGGGHVWLRGIDFEGATACLRVGGAHHKVLGCRFAGFGRAETFTRATAIDLAARTDFLEIAFCLFEHPAGFAPWRSVDLDGAWPQWRFGIRGRHEWDRAPYRLHVHHCHFRDFPAKPADNYRSAQADAIEIAPLGSDFATNNIIEYCLFENINNGSAGSVCDIKAGSHGVFRYNTAINCAGRVDVRSARGWLLAHNWLEGTEGIAVYGTGHKLVDNRLIGRSGSLRLLRGNGDESFAGTGRQRVVDCLVQCNSGTLRVGLDWSSDPTTHLPMDVRVAGHDGAIESHGDIDLPTRPLPCVPSNAFRLTAAEVGPEAAPPLGPDG
jgi:hypothetical protein